MKTQQRREDEIEFLERLYALPSGAEEMTIENESTHQLAADFIANAEACEKRAGKGFHPSGGVPNSKV